MSILIGADLGTTKITALALDAATGAVVAHHALPNDAETTSPADKNNGFCEWDIRRIAALGVECLRAVAEALGERRRDVIGVGVTGQQHGVVIGDRALRPLSPFINWQDKRDAATLLPRVLARAGADAPTRAGCKLAPGYMGTTLFWMREQGILPADAVACFAADYFTATLTSRPPATDPTSAASSGLLDIRSNEWDEPLLAALGLPRPLFPAVRASGEPLGGLSPAMAEATLLPEGLPVCNAIGDHQASFLGSVGDPAGAVLVNVGTGGQVAAFRQDFLFDPQLETRPYPRSGYLLVSAGLCGGAAYAVLERFFRMVAGQLLGVEPASLFERMNELAASIPNGADGLRIDPFFSGTRAQPELRGAMAEASPLNFTPAHLTRATLEGMARAFRAGYERIALHVPPTTRLVGAGNGLRENPLLASLVSEAFGLPMHVAPHREEAAVGAARVAALGLGMTLQWT